jgi:hypothetical protein
MKVLAVVYNTPEFTFNGKRNIKLTRKLYLTICTDVGIFEYEFLPGFETDGRSGPRIIDWILPHYGSTRYAMCWIPHDGNFDAHCMSFKESNELFRAMLVWSKDVRYLRIRMAYRAVSSCFGRHFYSDKQDKQNIDLIKFKEDRDV